MSRPSADPTSTQRLSVVPGGRLQHPDYRVEYEAIDPDQRPPYLQHAIPAFNDQQCTDLLKDHKSGMRSAGYRFIRCRYFSGDGQTMRVVAINNDARYFTPAQQAPLMS